MPRIKDPDHVINPRRAEANRRNAQKSTGPRSLEGRALSSRNALKHGLTADKLLLDDEDPTVFASWRDRLLDTLRPVGPIEELIAEKIISHAWRLRRVPAFENAILAWSRRRLTEMDELAAKFSILRGPTAVAEDADEHTREKLTLGAALELLVNSNALDKLQRYESNLYLQFQRFLGDLDRVQRRRLENDTDPDLLIDGTPADVFQEEASEPAGDPDDVTE